MGISLELTFLQEGSIAVSTSLDAPHPLEQDFSFSLAASMAPEGATADGRPLSIHTVPALYDYRPINTTGAHCCSMRFIKNSRSEAEAIFLAMRPVAPSGRGCGRQVTVFYCGAIKNGRRDAEAIFLAMRPVAPQGRGRGHKITFFIAEQ